MYLQINRSNTTLSLSLFLHLYLSRYLFFWAVVISTCQHGCLADSIYTLHSLSSQMHVTIFCYRKVQQSEVPMCIYFLHIEHNYEHLMGVRKLCFINISILTACSIMCTLAQSIPNLLTVHLT